MPRISIPHKRLIGLGFSIRELCLLVQNFIFLCHSTITTFHFSSGKKNQKRYINTFVKGTHCTSKTVCRQESPRPWPDLSLSPEPSHLHELLQWLLRPGLLQAGLQGGGEAAAEGGGPGGGARRPQLGGLGQAGGVLPAQGLGRPSGAGNGRPAPALDQPSPRCWRTAPAALLALCRRPAHRGAPWTHVHCLSLRGAPLWPPQGLLCLVGRHPRGCGPARPLLLWNPREEQLWRPV